MRLSFSTWCVSAALTLFATACGPSREPGFDVLTGDSGHIDDLASDSNNRDATPTNDTADQDVVDAGRDASAHDTGVDVPPLPPTVDIIAPGAPADAPTRFGGSPSSASAPDIVYPSAGTIVPHNLRGLEVHFHPGTGNDLFEVSFRGVSSAIRVYAGCTPAGGGCVLTLDDSTFQTIARAALDDGQVTLMVRGTVSAGGSVGSSATQTLGITATDLRGGIYYWMASGSIGRYEFGLPSAHAEVFILGNPFACVGCHVLSRQGHRIGVGGGIPAPALMQSRDVATNAPMGEVFGASFGTYSPDESRFLTSDSYVMNLRDTATGTVAAGLTPNTPGSMPDWSADNNHVVYSLPPAPPFPGLGSAGHNGPADLNVMDWDGTAFSAPRTLVHASGENNYYPAYSPDNAWVLFNRATGTSYGNIAAQLFAVPAAGGTPIRLAAADSVGMLRNSWPKWALFVDTYQGEPIMWFSFSSQRDYGLRLQGSMHSQLWMAAFRPNRAAAGDPSAPAFWLPFQGLDSGNHIAQWTQVVRRQTCHGNTDCQAGQTCQIIAAGGVCVGN